MSKLTIAELAIYATLGPAIIFILIRHGRHGAIGWGFLLAFAVLRVSGNALQLSASAGSGADIIANVGISPLLLATSGILHEARFYRKAKLHTKKEWICMLLFHVFVAIGIAMLAVGASDLESNSGGSGSKRAKDLALLRVGIAVLLLCWILIVGLAVFSLHAGQYVRGSAYYSLGSKLLYTILLTLPFSGLRILFGLVSLATQSASLNPVTGHIGLIAGLEFMPELIVVLAFIGIGLATWRVKVMKPVAETAMAAMNTGPSPASAWP